MKNSPVQLIPFETSAYQLETFFENRQADIAAAECTAGLKIPPDTLTLHSISHSTSNNNLQMLQ
jgi:hypothetical protein